VVVVVVGVEVEEDDDDWFPLREEDLKAETAITGKWRKMWENNNEECVCEGMR
jgi:hypothetical protein